MNKWSLLFPMVFGVLLYPSGTGSQTDTLSSAYFTEQKDSLVMAQNNYTPKENDPLPDNNSDRKFDENFRSRYTSDEFNYEIKPRKRNAFQRFLDWLFGPVDEKPASANSGLFLVWITRIVAFIVILYAVFAIVTILLGKKGNWLFDKNDQKRVITFPLSEENIHGEDYKTLFENAKKSGDYRMAIRYRYLMLLQLFATRGIINYHKDKTNSDYYYEINDKNLSSSFSYVSYIYEHIWYGGFELENRDFGVAEKAFDHTTSLLRYE